MLLCGSEGRRRIERSKQVASRVLIMFYFLVCFLFWSLSFTHYLYIFFVFCGFFFFFTKSSKKNTSLFPFFLIKPFISCFETLLPLLPLNLLLKCSLSDLGKSLTFFPSKPAYLLPLSLVTAPFSVSHCHFAALSSAFSLNFICL